MKVIGGNTSKEGGNIHVTAKGTSPAETSIWRMQAGKRGCSKVELSMTRAALGANSSCGISRVDDGGSEFTTGAGNEVVKHQGATGGLNNQYCRYNAYCEGALKQQRSRKNYIVPHRHAMTYL